MDVYDFYFKQFVTQVELNNAFFAADIADKKTASDRAQFGLLFGGTPSAAGGWNVTTAAFAGYDKAGQRVASSSPITQSVQTDTAGASTLPSAGNRRWVSVFARYGRDLTDARVDGLGTPLFFSREEALNPDDVQAHVGKLLIVAGGQALTSDPVPSRPALDATAILLFDVLIADTDVAVAAGMLSTTRTEKLAQLFKWGMPAATEFGEGFGSKYVLMTEAPSAGAVKSRMYSSTDGICITQNARWDGPTRTWVPDANVSGVASRVKFSVSSIDFDKRTTYAASWDESGWDSNMSLSLDAVGSKVFHNGGDDVAFTGTSTALWSIGTTSNAAGSAVTWRVHFSAPPSSVVLSTVGTDFHIAAVAAGTATEDGVVIGMTGDGFGNYSATRLVTATY